MALIVAPVLLCVPGAVGAAPIADAQAPTCRGVPATITGTDGDDVLEGTDGDDVIVGGEGIDQIHGRAGDDLICGGASRFERSDGDLVYQNLTGGEGADTVVGGSGSDGLRGEEGEDTLYGGDSEPELVVGDILDGGKGTDRSFGGPGTDLFEDWDGDNQLSGGAGADRFVSGPGNDDIRGGAGPDIVSYVNIIDESSSRSHCSDIVADLRLGSARGPGFGTDSLQGIEDVWTGGGNDVLTGDDGANTFYAGLPLGQCDPPYGDAVNGNGGTDRITFDTDSLEGGSAFGPVHVDLYQRWAVWDNQGSSPPIVVTLTSVEDVTGTRFADLILGDKKPNSLSGGGRGIGLTNDDSIRGRRGADRLYGWGGNDRLYGGRGADELHGQRGTDLVSGQGGSDRLYGERGPDALVGGSGNDRLGGGAGRNRNDGGSGIDTCRHPREGIRALRCER